MYTINTFEDDNYYVIYNSVGKKIITISKRNTLEEVLMRLKIEREEVIIC